MEGGRGLVHFQPNPQPIGALQPLERNSVLVPVDLNDTFGKSFSRVKEAVYGFRSINKVTRRSAFMSQKRVLVVTADRLVMLAANGKTKRFINLSELRCINVHPTCANVVFLPEPHSPRPLMHIQWGEHGVNVPDTAEQFIAALVKTARRAGGLAIVREVTSSSGLRLIPRGLPSVENSSEKRFETIVISRDADTDPIGVNLDGNFFIEGVAPGGAADLSGAKEYLHWKVHTFGGIDTQNLSPADLVGKTFPKDVPLRLYGPYRPYPTEVSEASLLSSSVRFSENRTEDPKENDQRTQSIQVDETIISSIIPRREGGGRGSGFIKGGVWLSGGYRVPKVPRTYEDFEKIHFSAQSMQATQATPSEPKEPEEGERNSHSAHSMHSKAETMTSEPLLPPPSTRALVRPMWGSLSPFRSGFLEECNQRSPSRQATTSKQSQPPLSEHKPEEPRRFPSTSLTRNIAEQKDAQISRKKPPSEAPSSPWGDQSVAASSLRESLKAGEGGEEEEEEGRDGARSVSWSGSEVLSSASVVQRKQKRKAATRTVGVATETASPPRGFSLMGGVEVVPFPAGKGGGGGGGGSAGGPGISPMKDASLLSSDWRQSFLLGRALAFTASAVEVEL